MRLFVAAGMPEDVRAAVDAAAAPARGAFPALGWTDAGGWHLTLAFLGATEPAAVPALEAALREACAQSAPAAVSLAGRAERGGRGTVLWVPLASELALQGVAAAVRSAVLGAGLTCDERPFRGHLTLARARGRARVPAEAAAAYAGTPHAWTVRTVALLRSHLGQGPGRRARYEVLATFPLGGCAQPPPSEG